MQELKSYVSKEERISGLTPLDVKKSVDLNLGVGIATLYRWLKSGDYYIKLLHSGTEDGEGPGLAVYKLEKIVE